MYYFVKTVDYICKATLSLTLREPALGLIEFYHFINTMLRLKLNVQLAQYAVPTEAIILVHQGRYTLFL